MNSIPVNTPLILEEDRRAVVDCLESGWISSEGPQVGVFEQTFASTVGRSRGVAVSSGTGALDIVVRALGLGPGDEVLVPSLTIISCAQAIVNSGATPVPVECDATDWNAHLHHFETRLSPRTKAVLLVHLYGLCADLDPILAWARAHQLQVIEDASQALGLRYKGKPCGSFGDVSVFSLYANKIITTGEGGMIVCDSSELADRCASLRNLCFESERRFWHRDLGWNYRMTAMQAALGRSQLARLGELVERKRAIGLRYRDAFARHPHLTVAPAATPYATNGYWVFGAVVNSGAPLSRDALLSSLAERGIGTRTFFYGLHEQPVLLERQLISPVSLPVTESLARRGFYLPSGLGLTDEQQARVIDEVSARLGTQQ